MKQGDLVRLKNLDKSWGDVALITRIHRTSYGTGQIYLMSSGCVNCAIPWIHRKKYICDESEEDER